MSIRRYPIDAGQLALNGVRAIASDKTRSVALPSTEADADATTFVCEFVGGAAANETGVGGGLAGADLVLTQAGSIAASSNGWRTLDATDDRFTVTQVFLDTLLKGTEWSIVYHLRNWTSTSEKVLFAIGQTTAQVYINVYNNWNYGSGGSNRSSIVYSGFDDPSATSIHGITFVDAHSTTAETMVAVWYKNSILHAGWVASSSVPTGWDSFPTRQRLAFPGVGDWSGKSFTGNKLIVGGSSGGGFDISKVIVSKRGLAAAPL